MSHAGYPGKVGPYDALHLKTHSTFAGLTFEADDSAIRGGSRAWSYLSGGNVNQLRHSSEFRHQTACRSHIARPLHPISTSALSATKSNKPFYITFFRFPNTMSGVAAIEEERSQYQEQVRILRFSTPLFLSLWANSASSSISSFNNSEMTQTAPNFRLYRKS